MKLILASKSPRRKEILEKFNFEFKVEPSDIKEKKIEKFENDEKIEKLILDNSAKKAKDVYKKHQNNEVIVISADTTVVLEGMCLNKPRNKSEAFLCLKKLSNKVHEVKTAIVLCGTKGEFGKVDKSKVYFRELKDSEIREYLEKCAPYDKAGSYGIQDFFKADEIPNEKSFIRKIDGSYYNIMGICPNLLFEMIQIYNCSSGTFNL